MFTPRLRLLSNSYRDLADDPRRCLGAEADFEQLLLEVFNRIRLKCNRVVFSSCTELLPALVLLRIFEGCYRDAYDRVFVAIVLTLVDLERDPALFTSSS